MTKFSRILNGGFGRIKSYRRFQNRFLPSIPAEVKSAAKFMFFPMMSREEKIVAKDIESFRAKIPEFADEDVYSYWSPHHNEFEKDGKGHAKAGPFVKTKVKSHLRVGANKQNGILLRRIIQGFGSKRILELGTNTGFSACYFLSVPNAGITTIEGSESLCSIADKNIQRISKNYRILNMLFDDAIDLLIEEGANFDCAFIDGQHEKQATLHYTDRILPLMASKSIIIHDDIYWSEGMNEAWSVLCNDYDFPETVDLLLKGICILDDSKSNSAHYDIGQYIPRPRWFRKGW
jgi:predicted O-methyltransferase YrrM